VRVVCVLDAHETLVVALAVRRAETLLALFEEGEEVFSPTAASLLVGT
jgi:hypothetical protein